MNVAIGSDHGGFEVKEVVREGLLAQGATVEDLGCRDGESVDYPDYAREVAVRVARGDADQGVLVCTTGIGMSIVANRFPGVRAALCLTEDMAAKARAHNDANVLVLGGGCVSAEDAKAILRAWSANSFSGAERHSRRLDKVRGYGEAAADYAAVRARDPEVHAALAAEAGRQRATIDLIASENHASRAVRQCLASELTDKYAEGYPDRRWYNGCANADTVEQTAIDRARDLFGAEHVNVQPHCGSAANMAVYFAVLQPGDTILAMRLAHGGHLTHGHDINFSGRLFNIVSYGVRRDTEQIDLEQVASLAAEHRPRLIVVGASAYPRLIDFARFREIADSVGAYLMVDMAHIAGLVAGGAHPSPVPLAEFVTGTTHKTLRGPRGGMILCRAEFGEEIDRQIFPGLQGGPLMNVIAAKAVCYGEAAQPAFREYAAQIVANAQAMAEVFASDGFRLVAGGTDNHLMLLDVAQAGLTGKDAAAALEASGIVANKNTIPFDTRPPAVTSGIRIGTPAATSRGMKERDMARVATLVARVLRGIGDDSVRESVRAEIAEMAAAFPLR